jgi:putative endonuclease
LYRDYPDIRDAIDDEKRIKRWHRKWKLALIEAMNPQWRDLYDEIGS